MKTFTAICELKEAFPTWGKVEEDKITLSFTKYTTHCLEVKQNGNSWLFGNEDEIPNSSLDPDEPFEAKLFKSIHREHGCCKCGKTDGASERYSLGITAGIYCDEDWDKAPYRKEGPEGYDFYDAGEYYEDDY